MIRILLVRHATNDLLGQVLYGRRPGVRLNAEGIRQAHAIADRLAASCALSEVVSSPLERALETAAAIAGRQNLTVTIDDDLTEIDFGTWTGTAFSELLDREDWRNFNRRRATTSPPGGESMLQVQARAWRSIMRTVDKYRDEDVALAFVTHGDVVRSVLLLVLGMPIDLIHRLEISPASLSEIRVWQNVTTVYGVNQILYEGLREC
ncbi:MAG: histidine phosphatase family protein [Acidobacteriaceae bacterium]|nr:histidine phosphatase family protein [Acidobacteriaceae bacterium]